MILAERLGQPDTHFGRILAAYGGEFVAGSLGWAMVFDAFRPDRYDLIAAAICLLGVAVVSTKLAFIAWCQS